MMKKQISIICCAFFVILIQSCGIYNFSGSNTTAKTVQVNFFQNYADQSPGSTIEPGLDRDFTNALQDLITNLTSLTLTGEGGELVYEGEIVEYRISPMSAQANQTASQNRLTMTVNVRFFNNVEEESDFEKRFSFFFDYPAAASLPSIQAEAHEILFERITQDIFNESLANW